MNILEFIFQVFVMICFVFMFIAWLGVKYDIVGRDDANRRLQDKIIKLYKKETLKKIKEKERKNKENV